MDGGISSEQVSRCWVRGFKAPKSAAGVRQPEQIIWPAILQVWKKTQG